MTDITYSDFRLNAQAGAPDAGLLSRVLRFVLFMFVLDTLFDPADLLFHLKLPLYAAAWLVGILVCIVRHSDTRISFQLVVYCIAMILVPLLSVLMFQIFDGNDRFEGYSMLKAYIFISMAVLLYVTRTNLLPTLATALTVLAIVIFLLTALVVFFPILFLPIYGFGQDYKIFGIDERDYGGLVMFQMYFVTSSMLVMAVAYYFDLAWRSRRKMHWFALVVCCAGMVVAGTRNNIAVAILVPLVLAFMYARRKLLMAGVLALVVMVGITASFEQLSILLSPGEYSNQVKLNMINDYLTILENPVNMWFGRGLGAYNNFTGRGQNFVTELTYLEIFRNYGVVMGMMIVCLLLFPLIFGFLINRKYPRKHVLIAYAMYLLMCATNPLLFSSPGMLVLSIVLADIFMYRNGIYVATHNK